MWQTQTAATQDSRRDDVQPSERLSETYETFFHPPAAPSNEPFQLAGFYDTRGTYMTNSSKS